MVYPASPEAQTHPAYPHLPRTTNQYSSPHTAPSYFYESLYTYDAQSSRPARESEEKEAALRVICADGQNLKLLATFRKYLLLTQPKTANLKASAWSGGLRH